jgi:hypothetical protein
VRQVQAAIIHGARTGACVNAMGRAEVKQYPPRDLRSSRLRKGGWMVQVSGKAMSTAEVKNVLPCDTGVSMSPKGGWMVQLSGEGRMQRCRQVCIPHSMAHCAVIEKHRSLGHLRTFLFTDTEERRRIATGHEWQGSAQRCQREQLGFQRSLPADQDCAKT